MLLFGIYSFFGFEFLRGTAEKIPTITFLNSLEILIRLGQISNICKIDTVTTKSSSSNQTAQKYIFV